VSLAADSLSSAEQPSLERAVEVFLDAHGTPRLAAACLGVAGPILEGRATLTNLPWDVDERRLAGHFAIPRVRLLNDLEAMSHGVLGLGPDALAVLQPGVARQGNRALISAGTGLGEAMMLSAGDGWSVMSSEGGHADFAPRTDLEIELLRFLRKEFGRVSYERLLSGPGLVNIYRFLRASGLAPESAAVRARLDTEDPAAVIGEIGLTAKDPLCTKAVEVFVEVYGAEAGNLALKALAVGGVTLGGGIAPKLLPALATGGFLQAFAAKGRLSSLMRTIPVNVALDPQAPLLGAARVAAGLLR
jgi:glucokinase